MQNRPISVADLGIHLIENVRKIDLSCSRKMHGVENGLCNIDRQFKADVAEGIYPAPPRSVKVEDAITWLLSLSLPVSLHASLWTKYPNSRKTCDLVVTLDDGSEAWIELKMGWKAWQNCDGSVGGNNPAYQKYLFGVPGETHSVAQDFKKLVTLAPASAHLGALLIGFDSDSAPMEADVAKFETMYASGWTANHVQWRDRRSTACRINCWFWHHAPRAISHLTQPTMRPL
jgi:hypothetical protein